MKTAAKGWYVPCFYKSKKFIFTLILQILIKYRLRVELNRTYIIKLREEIKKQYIIKLSSRKSKNYRYIPTILNMVVLKLINNLWGQNKENRIKSDKLLLWIFPIIINGLRSQINYKLLRVWISEKTLFLVLLCKIFSWIDQIG